MHGSGDIIITPSISPLPVVPNPTGLFETPGPSNLGYLEWVATEVPQVVGRHVLKNGGGF